MGENDVTITPRDMYEQIIGVRDDVQRMAVLFGGTADRVTDHETRLRLIEHERQDYVTESDLRERQTRSLTISATLAGIVSALVGAIEFLISHR